MKVCSFGTTRIDFHIYKPEDIAQNYEELKIDNMDVKVGGSVFNTTTLLKYAHTNVMYYTILGNDELSSITKSALRNFGIQYSCTSNLDSKSPVTFIHIDSTGEKVMYSFDGNYYADDVLDILLKNYAKYDAFFTSCYEINRYNYAKLSKLFKNFHKRGKKIFMDLSPLVYRVPKEIWESLLPFITILTGTRNEFNILINQLDLILEKDLVSKFGIEKLYIKKGSKGCTVVSYDNAEQNFSVVPIKSKNLTGCGDAFNAGVILGELSKLSTDNIVGLASNLAGCVAKIGLEPEKIVNEIDLNAYLSNSEG